MAPPALFRMIPLAHELIPSLSTNEFCPVVWSTMFCPGGTGGGEMAQTGTSAAALQNPPVQIGWSGFPSSNPIHTCEPTGGRMKHPAWIPAAGTQGIAQLEG